MAAKLVRVMHARRSSRLSCGHFVTVGAAIVRADNRWICLPCRLARIREMTSSTRAAS